ncbi:MAG: thioesterase [Clostridiales bacterium]|nr:thioesterase [Clostridiales bacterium]
MSYSINGRVRFSETGEDGALTLPGVLNYFQDCSIFQSEDMEQGLKTLEKRKRCWLLSSWQVIISRYPGFGEKIVTTTFPYEFHGFMGLRNFAMYSEEGERLACANTFWSNINTETGLPEKLTPEDLRGYEPEPKLDMDYAPRKIALPTEWEEEVPFAVQRQHLDTNHHVNNCQYVRMAEEYLPDDFRVRQLRVEYRMQARFQDTIHPKVNRTPEKVIILLNSRGGKPYAIVEFTV